MLPVVAEIICVFKLHPLAVSGQDVAQLGFGRVDHFCPDVGIVKPLGNPIPCSPDDEVVEMGIAPSHCCLNVVVERIELAIRNLDPSPDSGLDAQEGDLELIDGLGGLGGRFLGDLLGGFLCHGVVGGVGIKNGSKTPSWTNTSSPSNSCCGGKFFGGLLALLE